MEIKVLCTLGPASLHPPVIRALEDQGVDLFRINLSHTPISALESAIELVQGCSSLPICLDTEGAQVRCGSLASTHLMLQEGQTLRLSAKEVTGTLEEITLRPRSTFDALRVGSVATIDFDGAALRVVELGEGYAEAVVARGGRIGSNKAVTIDPPPALPPLTDKDLEAVALGARSGIAHFALSFASGPEDVLLLRRLIPPGSYLISKIESRRGVRNMDGIISTSDAVLIDRGDLSREIPLEYVPFYQKVVVRRANRWNKPVFVATNLLESMVTNRRPTVAEANDIANTLLDGVHGLVLAAETAIGIDPVGTVEMVRRSIRAFEAANFGSLPDEDRLQRDGVSASPFDA